VHNIESIKLLTINGDELLLSRKDDGLGLLALMNGSEGLLGVIIEITVKLKTKPDLARVIMAGFDSVRGCANSVADIIKAGIIPAGLEMIPALMISATELAHPLTESNPAIITLARSGLVFNFTVISIITPNRPSEPFMSASRPSPSSFLLNNNSSPLIVSNLIDSILCTVNPYFRQWTPPAFSATLPPIEQAICDDGSGA
jgi:FAD/FMN-containing dehydrogenase